eukprot:gene17461-35946_t
MGGLFHGGLTRTAVFHAVGRLVHASTGGAALGIVPAGHAADGGRSYFEIHYLPDVQNGEIEGLFIELHDITERRRTEEFVLHANQDLEDRVRERSEELFASEQRYRLMVDAIQDYCIYFVDEHGTVVDWTESAQRLHGHHRSQIVGQSYETLMCTDNAGEDEVDPGQVLRLAKEHGQWESRGWRLREDGSRFWAHTVLTALRNEVGELQGLSSITRDMTAAKSLEDVMNDLNRELEKRVAERTQQLVAANKDLDVFSHMVSHDLRAPLRHIASFVSLLQEQTGNSTDNLARQYQTSIAKASKRMSLMIEGLLEYARLEGVPLREAERKFIGCTTIDLATYWAEKRGLPRPFVNVIRWIETPRQATEDIDLVAVVSLARDFCRHNHVGSCGDPPRTHLPAIVESEEWRVLRDRVFPGFNLRKFELQAHADCHEAKLSLQGSLKSYAMAY